MATSNAAVVGFPGFSENPIARSVLNPTVDGVNQRWESTFGGASEGPPQFSMSTTILSDAVGVGPSTTANDPLYDSATNAFLLGYFLIDAESEGLTELSLSGTVISGAVDPDNIEFGGVTVTVASVPEPAMSFLLAIGGIALATTRRRLQ